MFTPIHQRLIRTTFLACGLAAYSQAAVMVQEDFQADPGWQSRDGEMTVVWNSGDARQKMNDICSVAGDSEAMVQDISHAIREQGEATDVIAQQVENVAQQANENSRSADSCQKLAHELTAIAHGMDDVLRSYQL